MAHTPGVKLLKRIKISGKWARVPALYDSKGRIRRDHVRVNGTDEVHPEGSYFVEFWDHGKRSREAAGPDAFVAAEKARVRQAELSAMRQGIISSAGTPASEPERTTVAEAVKAYTEYIQYHRSLRTFRTYRPILAAFRDFCSRTYIDEVGREDLLGFATSCLKQGQKGKSVYNKLVVLSQLLKQHGKSKVLKSADWPSFVATVRPIYENAELENLFANRTPEEEMRFKFYLMSGFRDAEGRFLTWHDVDFRHNAVRVTSKPQWGFNPKNWDEREVPVPQKLIALLGKSKPGDAGPDDPVFPSLAGRPDGDMLDKLKRIAWRAKLNCGHCVTVRKLSDRSMRTNRCSAGPFCKR